MYKELMLPITGSAGDGNAMEVAITLATGFDAHLAVVDSTNLPMPFPPSWGVAPSEVLALAYDELQQRADKSAERLRHRLEKESISWEVRTPESILVEPPHLLSLHARYADLVVMTAPDADEDKTQVVRECFTAILFGSGRPVLVVPPHPVTAPVRHLVVAWQPTPEATRALHDALPLLRQAASVDVVSVDPSVDDLRHGDDPGVDIATHLSRHGLRVNVVALPRAGMSVAEVLLRHAKESGAHCLIAGGYGHSRLREWFLGGTTRELLALARLPVLFSR